MLPHFHIEENICAPITYFQCKNNYEHLLNSGSVLLTRRALPLLSQVFKILYNQQVSFSHWKHVLETHLSFVFGHIARYAPSHEENICAPITYFQCKNNYEHLLNSGSVLLTRRALPLLSRCSKLFYTISRCHFHIESTFSRRICVLRLRSHSPLCSLTRRKHLRPDNVLSM